VKILAVLLAVGMYVMISWKGDNEGVGSLGEFFSLFHLSLLLTTTLAVAMMAHSASPRPPLSASSI
jgi:hypothetical protein